MKYVTKSNVTIEAELNQRTMKYESYAGGVALILDVDKRRFEELFRPLLDVKKCPMCHAFPALSDDESKARCTDAGCLLGDSWFILKKWNDMELRKQAHKVNSWGR